MKMDILSSTAKHLQFSPVVKDRLFYNKFQYCIGFRLDELSCLKILDHDYINTILARRIEWRAIHHQRTQRVNKAGIPTIHTILGRRLREITGETGEHLHALAEQLLTATDDYKLVTSVDQGWVYTNSKDLIQDLSTNATLQNKYYTEAVVDRPANTIKLKNSPYQQRTYLKVAKLTSQQKTNLAQFFANQQGYIRPSPALVHWFTTDHHRTQDYFFVDHGGENWLVMLALVHGGLVRKTVDIIQG